MGGDQACIVRTCTGDVCVRRSVPSPRYSVSWRSIAGWSAGKLSAPKLYHSCSASGPNATVKPSSRKMSSISSMTMETGWREPRHVRRAGIVGSDSRGEAAADASAARAWPMASSTATRTVLKRCPASRRASRGSVPRLVPSAVKAPLSRPMSSTRAASRSVADAAAGTRTSARRLIRSSSARNASSVVPWLVISECRIWKAEAGGAPAAPAFRLPSSDHASAFFAAVARELNAFSSRTARSARILRSISIPALRRPFMKAL